MKSLQKFIKRKREALEGVPLRWLHFRKEVVNRFRFPAGGPKQVVFVIGCQRSGTNLMMEIFERDWDTKTYDEFSKLSDQDRDYHLRLNPLEDVARAIQRDRPPLVIVKPLVETQNAGRLLSFFQGSKAIFMYRNYRDVAASNLKHWGMGNGIKNLRAIVEDQPGNWRAERVPEPVRQVVLRFFSEDMLPYDAAAIFWYVRNAFFYELQLDIDPCVLLCRYEDLVASPRPKVEKIYTFIGQDHFSESILPPVYTSSVKRGRSIDLSPEVESLCQDLQNRLDQTYARQWARLESQAQAEPELRRK